MPRSETPYIMIVTDDCPIKNLRGELVWVFTDQFLKVQMVERTQVKDCFVRRENLRRPRPPKVEVKMGLDDESPRPPKVDVKMELDDESTSATEMKEQSAEQAEDWTEVKTEQAEDWTEQLLESRTSRRSRGRSHSRSRSLA